MRNWTFLSKQNNDDNYIAITFINKTHYPHDYIDDSKEIILKSIKKWLINIVSMNLILILDFWSLNK